VSTNLYSLIGLAAGVAFILALKGLSHPKTARRGNLIGAAGATVATLSVFLYVTPPRDPQMAAHSLPLNHLWLILGAIAAGLIVGHAEIA
jgi:NAD(P) transhydrogenase subunit beta